MNHEIDEQQPSTTIKFLTFNTWGLKYVSKSRRERLKSIAAKINNDHLNYDIIALQEIWCQEDWEYIDRSTSINYPFRRNFYSGIISGPGLAILSKFPIEDTFLYKFPINGRPSAFWRGDWYVGKSIAVTLLKPIDNNTSPLAILNSHMHAPYSLKGDAAYECHRSCQAWDFAKISKILTKAGYAVVIVGDLNSRPGSLPHKFLTLETGLIDSWEQLKGVQNLNEIQLLSPDLQIEIGGTTCDSILNTWRQNCQPNEACRLDYALIDPLKLQTLDAKVTFVEQIPGIGSYSDHFAYHCTLKLLPFNNNNNSNKQKIPIQNIDRKSYLNQMLNLLDDYSTTSLGQKFWRLFHFWASIIILIIILIVTSFTSFHASWSSIFWVLLAIIISITGLIDGLIGYLFGNKELRALEEIKQQVQDSIKTIID
ncbi:hypothetical protein WICMUC_000419 [Wickerhamomyces mucosus]|uniref:Endonuclease/exonuclease/phosphatase domain-containing protein n=1 Tax=Wickerhamomyces mucosus TaxID=1378264 RepID=A0A9P8THY2_9ASCO|nr:hypothetical protein WICMUC_000419 [Wickerhamomyces mucosus]